MWTTNVDGNVTITLLVSQLEKWPLMVLFILAHPSLNCDTIKSGGRNICNQHQARSHKPVMSYGRSDLLNQ